MLRGYKVRLYPDKHQKEALDKSFDCCRWYWNYALALTNETYQKTGKGLSRADIQKLLPGLKKEHEWLTYAYSQSLQVVALNLSQAFLNFFEKRAKYPNFKSKRNKQLISYPQNVKIEGDYLKLPGKVGKVYAKFSQEVIGKIKTVTVSKFPSGEYYASLLVDDGNSLPLPSTEGKAIGIDLGLTDFVITSDGSKFNNPKWFAKREKNLKRKQQSLARKTKGSNTRNKTRVLVAKVHNQVARCRADFLHKLSRRIVDENQVIVVENLNVKGMVKNPNLSKAINTAGWGMFCTMLKYKAEQKGKVYLEVDRFFPSSKTCNNCLHQISELPLDVRAWTCPYCGTHHDRDINAAINIRNEGLRILSLGRRDTATGGRVRPSKGTTAFASGITL
jgi:putative transposase